MYSLIFMHTHIHCFSLSLSLFFLFPLFLPLSPCPPVSLACLGVSCCLLSCLTAGSVGIFCVRASGRHSFHCHTWFFTLKVYKCTTFVQLEQEQWVMKGISSSKTSSMHFAAFVMSHSHCHSVCVCVCVCVLHSLITFHFQLTGEQGFHWTARPQTERGRGREHYYARRLSKSQKVCMMHQCQWKVDKRKMRRVRARREEKRREFSCLLCIWKWIFLSLSLSLSASPVSLFTCTVVHSTGECEYVSVCLFCRVTFLLTNNNGCSMPMHFMKRTNSVDSLHTLFRTSERFVCSRVT